MTDLEKFIDTYKQFGIEVKTYEHDGMIKVNLNGWTKHATKSKRFHGYTGFYSYLVFTKEGKFLNQGFYE